MTNESSVIADLVRCVVTPEVEVAAIDDSCEVVGIASVVAAHPEITMHVILLKLYMHYKYWYTSLYLLHLNSTSLTENTKVLLHQYFLCVEADIDADTLAT